MVSTSHRFCLRPYLPTGIAPRRVEDQDHEIDQHFDNQVIRDAQPALTEGSSVSLEYDIRNTERAVGTMLGHEVTKAHGEHGLPADTISITLQGAGDSLWARSYLAVSP